MLLRALAEIRDLDWSCLFVGDGDKGELWRNLSTQFEVSSRVAFHPPVPMQRAREMIGEADLLVLPSHKEGWGVVVNEALMCGVPVLCSTNCGAQDLLDGGARGQVFEAGNARHLAAILRRRIEGGPSEPAIRAAIRSWSCRITGESTAAYLVAIMNHVYGSSPRPVAPWLGENDALPGLLLRSAI